MPRPLKVTLIVLGCLVGLFVVLGVVGALVAPDEPATPARVESAAVAPATTAQRATTTTARPARPVTLTGRGQDITRAVPLSDGRWRVTVEVSGNTDDAFGTALDSNVIVTAFGDDDYAELLVNDIAASGTWTGSLAVGNDIFEVPPGSVWFEVEVVRSATWTIRVEPL